MAISDQITRVGNEIAEQKRLLAELDAAVDALPDAGSGGAAVETCEVTFINFNHNVSYMDADGEFVLGNLTSESIVCQKSFMVLEDLINWRLPSTSITVTGGAVVNVPTVPQGYGALLYIDLTNAEDDVTFEYLGV